MKEINPILIQNLQIHIDWRNAKRSQVPALLGQKQNTIIHKIKLHEFKIEVIVFRI